MKAKLFLLVKVSISFLFSFLFFSRTAFGQENADLIQVISTDVQLISQLDQMNSHLATAYVDCLCVVQMQNDRVPLDPRCQNRKKTEAFSQTKINHAGEEFTEVKVCGQVVQKLLSRIQLLSNSLRTNLSLILTYRRWKEAGRFYLDLEMPNNPVLRKSLVVTKEIQHLEYFGAKSSPLEPLSNEEIQAVFNKYNEQSDQIRNQFLLTPRYQSLFRQLNKENVLEYLKNANPRKLKQEFAELAKNRPLSTTPWFSLAGLTEMFRIYTKAEQQGLLEKLEKEYQQDVDRLPVLVLLRNGHPTWAEILTAYLQIEKNATERSRDSRIALQSFNPNVSEGNEDYFFYEHAFLMDHQLSRKYLPAVLNNRFAWTNQRLEETVSYLSKLRDSQKQLAKAGEVTTLIGSVVVCMIPHPGIRGLTLAARALFRNFCLLGLSGGLNTYYLLRSHTLYEQKIQMLLSTPDGWNKLVKTNEVLEKREDRASWLLFYGLEFLPAANIFKLLL